jgi:hypothetical protein
MLVGLHYSPVIFSVVLRCALLRHVRLYFLFCWNLGEIPVQSGGPK